MAVLLPLALAENLSAGTLAFLLIAIAARADV